MIGFLHPWVLAGLAAAGIPVLLHLLARREPPTVLFPAVRYLVTTTRQHQRRLKLQHWLLLVLRTLLIASLVIAAAGPTTPMAGVPGHAPSALVLIVDNSPSSGAVINGSPQLSYLMSAGLRVLERASPDDAVWLLTADGVPRRGDQATLSGLLRTMSVSPKRLDLGAAIDIASDVLRAEPRPGEIVLLTDLQSSATSAASASAPVLVGRPDTPSPANTGIGQIETGAQPWSTDGGRISVMLAGDAAGSVPVSAWIGQRPPRQALGRVGGTVTLSLPGVPSGWWPLTAQLDADEFRLDDRRVAAIRVAPVARVSWDSSSQFIAAACEVLASNRRLFAGHDITLGRLGRGISVVQPPSDPAQVGALNRALAARGVGWTYGSLKAGPGSSDSGAILGRQRIAQRYTLEPHESGRTGVLATTGGAPWIVRGSDVVLLGSRLEPAWTDLPVSPGFMPFMDVLLNRLARGEVALSRGAPGDQILLPDRVTTVRQGAREWTVEGGGVFEPADTGIYFLEAGRDTVGAISANPDPRESRLARASDTQTRQLWRGARIESLSKVGNAVFSSASRGDLRGPLLWGALMLGLAEMGLASGWRRRA
jgi:hypothetical protein